MPASPGASADSAKLQLWLSPRRQARGTPRHLSERQRQRRFHHQQQKLSAADDDGSTDEAPLTPRGRRREPRSKTGVKMEPRSHSLSPTVAATAAVAVTDVLRPRVSDDADRIQSVPV